MIQKFFGYSSRQALILSKMHAEATFFVQLAFLSLLYFAVETLQGTPRFTLGYRTALASLIFIVLALEVTGRRIRRAKDYDTVHGISTAATQSPVESTQAK